MATVELLELSLLNPCVRTEPRHGGPNEKKQDRENHECPKMSWQEKLALYLSIHMKGQKHTHTHTK